MTTNSVTMIGNLTRDPELRYTTGGRAVANFGIAVGRRYQKNGEWQEDTSFFNVICWGDLGENVAATCGKGTRIIATGRMEQRSWETNEGEKRSVVELVADEVGPSLRWAQAEIQRNERTDGDQSRQQQQSSNGGGGAGSGQGYGTEAYHSDPIYGDEEPFAREATARDVMGY